MHVDENGKMVGLMDYYLHLFEVLALAPSEELGEDARAWFEQFDHYTWENEDDFINDFLELGLNFSNLASDTIREGKCSSFVVQAFDVIVKGMVDDIRILRGLGYLKGDAHDPI